jgi:phage gpG-like protein
MMKLNIKCDNRRAMLRLDAMKSAAKDFRPVFEWARRELAKSYKDNFTASGLAVGGWSPLKPQYASWKARNFPGAPLMVQSGKLFRDLSSLRGAKNDIRRAKATFSTSGIEYASFHQYGTSRMAKRVIVFEPPLFALKLAEEAKEHITDAANGVVRRGLP